MAATGYTRQSSATIQAGLAINAANHNNEFNQLQSAFDSITGHDHSGSASGTGQKIPLASAVTGTLPTANGGTGVTDGSNLLPPGVTMAYAAAAAPTGWLLCNGQAVSRATYAALFAVVSTTYGSGDGSTTFNLPDMRGRTVAGYDPANATGRLNTAVSASALGNSGGEQTHILTTAELPVHNHGITDPSHNHTHTESAHTHTVSDPTHTHTHTEVAHTHTVSDPTHTHTHTEVAHTHTISDPGHSHTVSDPGHSHTYVSANTGPAVGGVPAASGTGIGNNVISTTSDTTGITNNAASTGITNVATTTGITNNAASTGITNVATTTGITNNATTTGITVNNTGSGTAHNVIQPTFILNWIIKT